MWIESTMNLRITKICRINHHTTKNMRRRHLLSTDSNAYFRFTTVPYLILFYCTCVTIPTSLITNTPPAASITVLASIYSVAGSK